MPTVTFSGREFMSMSKQSSRRDVLKGSLALAGMGIFGVPEWVLPALAQGETAVPFTDLPEVINWRRTPDRRMLDIRTIDSVFTDRDEFFTTQHYGHPEIDPATYRLDVSGLVDQPLSLSIDEIRAMPARDLVFGFECSGNRGPINGLASNGRWTGVSLHTVLERAGVQPAAASSFSWAPTTVRRKWSSAGKATPWTSNTAAACSATRRCHPSRYWRTR